MFFMLYNLFLKKAHIHTDHWTPYKNIFQITNVMNVVVIQLYYIIIRSEAVATNTCAAVQTNTNNESMNTIEENATIIIEEELEMNERRNFL